jgi:hypothetical protein
MAPVALLSRSVLTLLILWTQLWSPFLHEHLGGKAHATGYASTSQLAATDVTAHHVDTSFHVHLHERTVRYLGGALVPSVTMRVHQLVSYYRIVPASACQVPDLPPCRGSQQIATVRAGPAIHPIFRTLPPASRAPPLLIARV